MAGISVHAQKIFLQALAGRKGVTVHWDKECDAPSSTSKGSITLPPPTVDNSDWWAYWSHHQVSHVFGENIFLYKAISDGKGTAKKDSEMKSVVRNILADYIVDTSIWGEYPGRDKIMDQGRAELFQNQVTKTPPDGEGESFELIMDLYRADWELRCSYKDTPRLNLVGWSFPEYEFADKLRKMSLEDKLEEIRVTQSPALLNQLTEEILKLLDEPPEDGEGEGEGKGEGAGEGKGDASKAPKMSPDMSDADKDEDLIPGIGEDRSGDYVPSLREDVIDLSKGRKSHTDCLYKEITKMYETSTLTRQVRKYLMTMKQTRWEGGKKVGTIQPKNMSRVYTSSSHQPTIYKTKTNSHIEQDSAVTLLVDFSGSMCGDKFSTASACAVSMSDVLTALRIKHEILGFTENFYGEEERMHYVLKPFNGAVKTDELVKRFSDKRIKTNNNDDGASLIWAASRIINRSEKNKTIIVFSDGNPAARACDCSGYLKRVVHAIENQSNVNLIGIGIMSNAVQKFYKVWKVVNNTSGLETAMMDSLKQIILK